ncbi:hypothetical protein CHARACLAT_014980 [Characodon lateralis]|uniref:Uncharacterized protein n=1 Tax=Characodon lateralis TaxID=208331 RepID=A0ABU7EU06_9TELE|nr:hypothetical protein [Characodon lateralis]
MKTKERTRPVREKVAEKPWFRASLLEGVAACCLLHTCSQFPHLAACGCLKPDEAVDEQFRILTDYGGVSFIPEPRLKPLVSMPIPDLQIKFSPHLENPSMVIHCSPSISSHNLPAHSPTLFGLCRDPQNSSAPLYEMSPWNINSCPNTTIH